MTHRNAPLTVEGPRRLVQDVVAGEPVLQAAQWLRVSRTTVYRWVRRFRELREAGLQDRSSRSHRTPRATPRIVVRQVPACRGRGIGSDWMG